MPLWPLDNLSQKNGSGLTHLCDIISKSLLQLEHPGKKISGDDNFWPQILNKTIGKLEKKPLATIWELGDNMGDKDIQRNLRLLNKLEDSIAQQLP